MQESCDPQEKIFMWIAGISEKHYSKIKDLGVSSGSIYTKVM